MAIELGDKAKDIVSGWKGTVTGRFEYMNGCIRIEISGVKKDGTPEGYVFDEEQVEVTGKARKRAVTPSGGPRSSTPPSRR